MFLPETMYTADGDLYSFSKDIRHSALEKLAALAVQAPAVDEGSDIARLMEQCRRSNNDQPNGLHNGSLKSQSTSRVPMVRLADMLLINGNMS